MIADGGANFTALVRLTNKRGEVLALPGKSCAKVPATSLGWLERAGKIKRSEKTVRDKPSTDEAESSSETKRRIR